MCETAKTKAKQNRGSDHECNFYPTRKHELYTLKRGKYLKNIKLNKNYKFNLCQTFISCSKQFL